jgi:hypothetical protein
MDEDDKGVLTSRMRGAPLADRPTPIILSGMEGAILSVALTLATVATAFGCGREGHEAIGELARATYFCRRFLMG